MISMIKMISRINAAAVIAVAAAVLVLPAVASAESVGVDEAGRLARRFAEARGGRGGLRGSADVRLRHTGKRRASAVGAGLAKGSAAGGEGSGALLYVFDVGDSGFVIVSGDDVARPVLGYSDNGGYDADGVPPNFAYWMGYLERQIEYAVDNAAKQSEAVAAEFTVGPNPAVNRGAVKFFHIGKPISDCELRIYDALGNVVRKIRIGDREITGSLPQSNPSKRLVAVWDLTDAKGRPVSVGAYLVKGVIRAADGNKENVSMVVGVR